MVKMKPYIHNWYKDLEAGKITGIRCSCCGSYDFPPVPICNECSSTDVEVVEMSGDAEIQTFTYNAMGIYPYSDDPVVCVGVTLKEGPSFLSWLVDSDEETADKMLTMELPIPVKAEIRKMDEGVYWPAFRLSEQSK